MTQSNKPYSDHLCCSSHHAFKWIIWLIFITWVYSYFQRYSIWNFLIKLKCNTWALFYSQSSISRLHVLCVMKMLSKRDLVHFACIVGFKSQPILLYVTSALLIQWKYWLVGISKLLNLSVHITSRLVQLKITWSYCWIAFFCDIYPEHVIL